MRLIIDSLIALMLVLLLGGVVYYNLIQHQSSSQSQPVQQGLIRLREQMLYHGALGQRENKAVPFPARISPLWFDRDIPFNSLVPGRQPWMDLAPQADMSANPPDPVIEKPTQAGFWYNPNRGIIRARVVPQFTEADTLNLYNQINGTALTDLAQSGDPARQPMPLTFARLAELETPSDGDNSPVTYASNELPTPATVSGTAPQPRPRAKSLVDQPR